MLNETLNATTSILSQSMTYFKDDFLARCIAILSAPFEHTEMLWMLLPLLATLILIEIYLGRYKDEEAGWNTAFGNGIVLMFVAIDLFRYVYDPSKIIETGIEGLKQAVNSGDLKIIIALFIFAFALLIMFIDFFHFLPKKIAYAISSPAYLNFIALLGIIIVYSQNIPMDIQTLTACVAIIAFFTLIMQILYWLIPAYESPLQRILTIEDIEKNSKKK